MIVRNRIVLTAMHLGYTPEGEVTDRLVEFYAERARGGVGLIIVGGCPIDEYGGMSSMVGISHEKHIPGLQRLTRAVHITGTKIAAQLYQAGRYTHSAMIGGRKPFSASAVRSRLTGETPRALELHEIPGVQGKFAEAAVRAIQSGFDAVEILGSAGYLISQFLSPLTNLREDGYGGSIENRMRFGIEIVQKVRKAVGPSYPIIMRLAGNDFMEGSNTNEEASVFAHELEKAGVDLFDVTGGWHETRIPQLTMFVPRRAFSYLARGIKSAVSVPVIASNRINHPQIGEEILCHGEADMVTMARGLLADPDLPEKARAGKAHQILRCVACNQGCFDHIFSFRSVACLVNPRAGREEEFMVTPSPKSKKVLVIGGGPAGMKAACVAAERGHRVTLVERSSRLGGQVLLNAMIPGRREMISLVEDLENNLKDLPVEIILSKEATVSFVKERAPDAVILATGAIPLRPGIPGINREKVVTAWAILSGREMTGRRVVIIGGNAVGLETALFLAHQGTISPEILHFLMTNKAETPETLEKLLSKGNKEVCVVEKARKAGADVGLSTRWTVFSELKRLGVKILTGAEVTEITEEGVMIETEQGRDMVPADSVVIAVGSKSENGLAGGLTGLVPELGTIGDAKEPRNAMEAVKEGFLAALKI
jgi:2,4-dienoyl-CoA reductase (NADPH2)